MDPDPKVNFIEFRCPHKVTRKILRIQSQGQIKWLLPFANSSKYTVLNWFYLKAIICFQPQLGQAFAFGCRRSFYEPNAR